MKVILLIAVLVGLAATAPVPDEIKSDNSECETKCKIPLVNDFNAEKEVVFTLFTRKNQESPQTIKFNDIASFKASNFNSNHPTRFIIHGYLSSSKDEVNTLIRSAYMENGEFNIIIVDWSSGATVTAYLCPKSRVGEVGTFVGRFIVWLNQISNNTSRRISVIGHSLGAHVAGFAGKHLNKNNQTLHTIIALDPAGFCFPISKTEKRVASTDAEYVEVIHTSFLGLHKPIGTTDFYPNWGKLQFDSHSQAYRFFADSINNPTDFMATKCASYEDILEKRCNSQNNQTLKMGGEPSNYGSTGIYYYHSNITFADIIITILWYLLYFVLALIGILIIYLFYKLTVKYCTN